MSLIRSSLSLQVRPLVAKSLLVLLAGILCFLLGCDNLLPPTEHLPTSPTPQSFLSHGLGVTKADWDRDHRLLADPPPHPDGGIYYDHGLYSVRFWPESMHPADDSRVYLIVFRMGGGFGAPLHEMLPTDAHLQQRIPLSEKHGVEVVVYQSASLAGRYSPGPGQANPWKGKPPGTIYVALISQYEGLQVTAIGVGAWPDSAAFY